MNIHRTLFIVLLTLIIVATCPALSAPSADEDRAVGILNKGQLHTATFNFGLLSSYHVFAPAMHWPLLAPDEQHYCLKLGFFVAVEDNVIESFLDHWGLVVDWSPVAGALGTFHSGEEKASDGTPIMATSDRTATWPEPGWPGPYRIDPSSGLEVVGEFVSDRDLFCAFDDHANRLSPLGVVVHESAYSYGRSYAEDFLFFVMRVVNRSDTTITGAYVGYYGDFRVDFDMADHIDWFDAGQGMKVIRYWDADGDPQAPWETVGTIGVGFHETPRNRGITDFHAFSHLHKPQTDETMWAVIASDHSDPAIDPTLYFHGADPRLDDPDSLRAAEPEGTSWDFFAATGPLDLAPGDTVVSAIVVVAGSDSIDLTNNLTMARQMAESEYQGPSPPPGPDVWAVPGDGVVTITWSASPETSTDPLTGECDFEGYRVYRSADRGRSWGDEVTDEKGNVVGYVPIAQFDLVDDITGKDPFSNQYLGDDTGLKHSYADSSVTNGIEYWYCVTAYDRGDQATSLSSLESPKGSTTDDRPVVSCVPGVYAEGVVEGDVGSIEIVGGHCDGSLVIETVDPYALTGHTYEVTFNNLDTVIVGGPQGLDTMLTTTLNLEDLTTGTHLLFHHPLSDSSKDNIPVTDGFRLIALDAEPEVLELGWTVVHGDTSTFDWFVEDREPGGMQGEAYVAGGYDYRITIDTIGGTLAQIDGVFEITDTLWKYMKIQLPVVCEASDGESDFFPADEVYLVDYRYGWDHEWFGPKGWDLIPGGAGYNPAEPHGDWFPDELGLYVTLLDTGSTPADTMVISAVHLRTQNGPADAIPPSHGDQFTITTAKPFQSAVRYRFATQAPHEDLAHAQLDVIRVVPNPYIVTSLYETSLHERKLKFNHVPNRCRIDIYTVAGDHVASLHHEGPQGYCFWDMRTKHGLNIAFGLYVYVVETPDGRKHTGKFLVIK
jgi:hypothetical protein